MCGGGRHGRGYPLGLRGDSQALHGSGAEGTFDMPRMLLIAYYGEWHWGKWQLAGEYWRIPYNVVVQSAAGPFSQPIDERNWSPLLSYQVTKKLQLGTYYSHSLDKAA